MTLMSTLRFDFLHFVKVVESTIWIQILGLTCAGYQRGNVTRINTTLKQEQRGVLALTARQVSTLFFANLISGCWDLGNWIWFLSHLAAETLQNYNGICEALRDTRIQLELPKNPPLRQIKKTKGFGAVYEGQWQPVLQLYDVCMFKSCGALITVHRTRYWSETDQNVPDKLYLLYWRLIRCRSELDQPSCFSTSSSFYRLPPQK